MIIKERWLPLFENDIQKLEKKYPKVANNVKGPSQLEKLEIPNLPEDTTVYNN